MNPFAVLRLVVQGIGLAVDGVRAVSEFEKPAAVAKADHYFPVFPLYFTPPLRPGQCANCRRWYPAPLPASGCTGSPVESKELA
jgi:hypothetical protein